MRGDNFLESISLQMSRVHIGIAFELGRSKHNLLSGYTFRVVPAPVKLCRPLRGQLASSYRLVSMMWFVYRNTGFPNLLLSSPYCLQLAESLLAMRMSVWSRHFKDHHFRKTLRGLWHYVPRSFMLKKKELPHSKR